MQTSVSSEETVAGECETSNSNHQLPQASPLPGEFNDTKHGILWNIWTTKEILSQCEQFQFRVDDIVVATYPKSGTTLMQEVVWLLYNNFDPIKARATPVYMRVPFLELNMFEEDKFGNNRNHIDILKEMPVTQTRLIKTHLPLCYLRDNLAINSTKVIYVMRNPKDTLVSYYHFYKGVDDYGPWQGSFEEFFNLWMTDHIVAGNWFEVISEWYTQITNPNYIFVSYEDILSNPREQYQRVADFCGRLVTPEQMEILITSTKFETMRQNPSTNYSTMPGINYQFMRKGQVGDWKNYFTVSQNECFDKVMQEKYQDTLPQFRYS